MIQIIDKQTVNVNSETLVASNAVVGAGTTIWDFVKLTDCEIGADCMISTFVEISSGVTIGARSRIQSHSFLAQDLNIGTDCFVAHGVVFVNYHDPQSSAGSRSAQIGSHVLIGSNATIMPVKIGDRSVIGAGSVVVDDVPPGVLVVGNPAQIVRELDEV